MYLSWNLARSYSFRVSMPSLWSHTLSGRQTAWGQWPRSSKTEKPPEQIEPADGEQNDKAIRILFFPVTVSRIAKDSSNKPCTGHYNAIYRFLNQHFGILSCGWWMVFPRTETERESCSEKLTMCIHLSRLRTVYCEQTMPTSTASSAMNSESPGTYFSDPFYTCRFGKNHRSIVFTTSISKGENSQNNVIPGELSHDVRASDPIAVAVTENFKRLCCNLSCGQHIKTPMVPMLAQRERACKILAADQKIIIHNE